MSLIPAQIRMLVRVLAGVLNVLPGYGHEVGAALQALAAHFRA